MFPHQGVLARDKIRLPFFVFLEFVLFWRSCVLPKYLLGMRGVIAGQLYPAFVIVRF